MPKTDISKVRILIGFLFLILIGSNNVNSKILYDKSGIIITELELQKYVELSFEADQLKLSTNKAIKRLVLQKKILRNLEKNDYQYLNKIDQEISNKIYENKFLRDFVRFKKIKNEFIIDYYNNNLNLTKFKEIIGTFTEIKLPISNNNCLTIIDFIDLKNNQSFQENFFSNLKNNTNNYSIVIDEKSYQICMNSKYLKELDSKIIGYIENQIEETFNDFIYNRYEKK